MSKGVVSRGAKDSVRKGERRCDDADARSDRIRRGGRSWAGMGGCSIASREVEFFFL